MKTAATKKSTSAKSTGTAKTKLFLVPVEAKPVEVRVSKYRAGDMDMLERDAGKPMPFVFEQMDRSYKTMHSFFGLPLPIV